MIQNIKHWVGCLVGFVWASSLSAQPNLKRVEYYIDMDPGYSKANSIPFTPAPSLNNFALNLNPGNLANGVHILGIRAQDANGAWSLDNKWLFVKPYPVDSTGPGPVPNLNRVEYYLDADPGYGKATSIPFSPGTGLTNFALNLNPGNITNGVHVLGIRAQDAKGAWSPDNKWLFARPYPADSTGPGPVPNLSRVEYYLDADPGYGKATAVAFTPGTGLANINININPGSLTNGIHLLGIRAQDAKGAWSLDNKWLFARPYPADSTGPGPVPVLAQVEYYIDKDPGYGKGIPVEINPVTNLPDFKLPVNIAGLSAGVHMLFIRSKSVNGPWSLDNKFNFAVSPAIPGPAIVVNSISDKNLCDKDSLRVSYQADGNYNTGNIFRVELSDTNGNFTAPKVIGSYTGTGNSIILCSLPGNLTGGNRYKVRVSSTNPVVTGITDGDSLTIHVKPDTPSVVSGPRTVSQHQAGLVYSVIDITGLTYIWTVPTGVVITSGQGTNSVKVTWATTSGTITVQANNTCGASATRSLAVSVAGLAIFGKSAVEGGAVQLYPNPAKDVSTLIFTAAAEEQYVVEVSDAAGKVLLVRKGKSAIGENMINLNVGNYAHGTYYISLLDKAHGRRTLRLVKSK